MADTNSILDLIDGALDDYGMGGDAFRWCPIDDRDDMEDAHTYERLPFSVNAFVDAQARIAALSESMAEVAAAQRSSMTHTLRNVTVVFDEVAVVLTPPASLRTNLDALALRLADAFFANVSIPQMSRRSRILYGRRRRSRRR